MSASANNISGATPHGGTSCLFRYARRRVVAGVVVLAAAGLSSCGGGGTHSTSAPAGGAGEASSGAVAATPSTTTSTGIGASSDPKGGAPKRGDTKGPGQVAQSTNVATTTATPGAAGNHGQSGGAQHGSSSKPAAGGAPAKHGHGVTGANGPSTGATRQTGAAGSGTSSSGTAPGAGEGVPYHVSTTSMEPTFQPFTTIYYDPTRTKPAIGDVILFYYPKGVIEGTCGNNQAPKAACQDPEPGLTTQIAIKRVVGLPGEQISMDKGQLYRNGQPVSEPYIEPCELISECEYPNPITVPQGDYYVLSDNRSLNAQDSRTFGAVPQAAILGTVNNT